jgi:hypothetical protein
MKIEIAKLNHELLKYINGEYDERLKAEAGLRLGEWY